MKGCTILCLSTEGTDTRYVCWLQSSRSPCSAE